MVNVLIVLYKKCFSESESLTSIAAFSKGNFFKDFRIIVWDNSPKKMNKYEFAELNSTFPELKFIHTPENWALSRIYNNVIENYIQRDDYLLLLDHDTQVTEVYFKEIVVKINSKTPPNLLLPKIVFDDRIVSPAFQYILFSKVWRKLDPGFYNSKYVTAINSGMVISAKFFSQGFRYNEKLLYYGTDNYMMYGYGKLNPVFYLLDSPLKHDLNLQSNPSIHEKARIFREIKRANLIIYSSNPFHAALARINNFIISVKYSIKYSSLIFFK